MSSEVHTESAVELEMSEMSEMSEDEAVTEEEFQKLLDEEYALRLEEEELLAIGESGERFKEIKVHFVLSHQYCAISFFQDTCSLDKEVRLVVHFA